MRKSSKRQKKHCDVGIAYINATFNNTTITITDLAGNALDWNSAGAAGFKGSRKGTPFAAQKAAGDLATKVKDNYQMSEVKVFVKGPGAGRENAIRALRSSGLEIKTIRDVTPLAHNGCRRPKKRRV